MENAAFTLTLADQHGASGLRDSAERFVTAHAAAVLTTEGWRHLEKARPELANSVMKNAISLLGGGAVTGCGSSSGW